MNQLIVSALFALCELSQFQGWFQKVVGKCVALSWEDMTHATILNEQHWQHTGQYTATQIQLLLHVVLSIENMNVLRYKDRLLYIKGSEVKYKADA